MKKQQQQNYDEKRDVDLICAVYIYKRSEEENSMCKTHF